MIRDDDTKCSLCGGNVKYYDTVDRLLRTGNRKTKWIKIQRKYCLECGKLHRALPKSVCPYKQYDSEIIAGVVEGLITPETLGYEDYPCELTMNRWKTRDLHIPL